MKNKILFCICILFFKIPSLFSQTVTTTAAPTNFNLTAAWASPTQVANGATIQNGHTINVPIGTIFYSGKIDFVGTGKLQLMGNGKWMPGPAITSLKSCKEILTYYPMTPSGQYTIDPDGAGATPSTSCYCDMTTDGGGWTLVLNYLHRGGTNPGLWVKTNSLPLLGSTILGTDESGSATTWGHTDPAYLNQFTFSELRFHGRTSASHGRVIHFKTTHANTVNYFRTGTGSMAGINTSFTALTLHSAFLPNSARDYFLNEASLAMTNFPFWLGGTYHWGIRGHGSRWEVDDFPGDARDNTHHQIWIR
jgi:hypothetical protein